MFIRRHNIIIFPRLWKPPAALLAVISFICALSGDFAHCREIDDLSEERDVIKGIGDLLGGGRIKQTVEGARVQIMVTDWAGRPTDGRVMFQDSSGQRFTANTTAARATLSGLKRGRYRVTLDPAHGRPPPARDFEVASENHLYRMSLRALRPLPRIDTAPANSLPGRAAIREQGEKYPFRVAPETRHRSSAQEEWLNPSSRNLAQGRRLVAQGQTMDQVGVPTDATVRFFQGSLEVGYVRTFAGRFSLYDLEGGEYRWVANAPWLEQTTGNIALSNIGRGTRLVVRVRRSE